MGLYDTKYFPRSFVLIQPHSYYLQIHFNEFIHFNQRDQRRRWHPTPVLLPGKSHGRRSLVGCSPWGCEELDTTEQLHFHFHFHALEEEMATHSSVLAWRIPGMADPSGLLSMGSHRVGHDWSDLAAAAAAIKEIYHVLWSYCSLCDTNFLLIKTIL